MSKFRVKIFKAGIWDGQAYKTILAADPKSAAEAICGAELRDMGPNGRLAAWVRPDYVSPGSLPIPFYAVS
jgi:hypothetical protein